MTREEFLRQEIEKYRRKIATYEVMIGEWESELGLASGQAQLTQPEGATSKKNGSGSDPLSLIPGLIFYRKSQPEAAKGFLEMVGYPLSTSQILEAIEKGGVTVGGKTPTAKKQNLYTILHRSSDFGLVKKDTWGIVGWPGVTKKADEEADQKDKKNGKEEAATGGESDANAGAELVR
jgi:hypothetical protein